MARLRLTPQKREFFVLFNQAAANARDIARHLVELLEDWPASRGKLADIRELDRDDMYRLASAIDDVCDHVDEAADNIDAYEVRDVPDKARQQAEVIHRSA